VGVHYAWVVAGVRFLTALTTAGAVGTPLTQEFGWDTGQISVHWRFGLFRSSSGFTGVGLSVFAVFYGLDWIATVPPTLRLADKAIGRERAPIVFGGFTAHQLGAATAEFGAGSSRSRLATYLPAFYIAGAPRLVAGPMPRPITRGI
jgi:hypothetical protein